MKRITKIEETKMLSIKKLRVAGYARVSTLSDEQLISLAAQKAYYKKYIKSNDEWEYAGLYYDEGVTGTKKDIREGLGRLIADCEQGLIDMIITKSISRFCRNTADCLELVRKLLNLNISIIFEKENINTGAMESELMLSILSSLAESESVSISDNGKWGAKKRFEKGSFIISYPPYGYKNESGNMLVVAEEATVVKEIFTTALEGIGTHAIAKNLNARNVKTKKGGFWSSGTVNTILKNEKYTGDVIFQKTYTDSSFKRHTNYGEYDQYLCKDHHEAIISHEIFDKANKMLIQRGQEKGNVGGTDKYQKRYSFSGRIKCNQCGSTFKRRIHYKPSGSYVAWCCNQHINDKDDCSMKYIIDDGVKIAFAAMVNKLIFSYQIILKPLMQNLQGLEDKDRLAYIAACERKLEKNIEQRQVLTSLMASSLLDTGVFNQENCILLQEYEKLRSEKENLAYSVNGDRTKFDALDNLIKTLSKMNMLTEFKDDIFLNYVDYIKVLSREEIVFVLKCGLQLKERLVV